MLYPDEEPCEDCQAPPSSPCRPECPNGSSPYDPPYVPPEQWQRPAPPVGGER